jgi:diguanylate cyclase (GGDEF)-like protein
MKILVAEDELTSRITLRAMLEKWGYKPVVTTDGEEAWRVLKGPDAPELAILDRVMPEMDGLNVVRRVRESNGPYPPYVILLTARNRKADIVKGLEAGGNDYICKPYDTAELKARLEVGRRMVQLQRQLAETRQQLAHEAMHDSLTGIMNRHAILNHLENELFRCEREGSGLGIGMCDIDHFKDVNDAHGHQVGDDVLKGAVKRLRRNLRRYDSVGRYDGEEFLIITPGVGKDSQAELLERLRREIGKKGIPTRKGKIGITASFGMTHTEGRCPSNAVLAAADEALYRAKESGRNCIRFAECKPEENPVGASPDRLIDGECSRNSSETAGSLSPIQSE